MKNLLLLPMLFVLALNAVGQENAGYPVSPVPFTRVKVTDGFWGQRLRASRETTIPLAFSKCEETGRYKNFEMAAHPGPQNKVTGYSFDDTDVYKTIEGASYLLQTFPDEKLKRYIDSLLVIVAAAQEPDGYLYTARTMNPGHPHEWAGSKRWEKVEELSHEFYNLGHMVEGAVAHYQATGQRNFLDIAIRYADCVCREIGGAPGQVIAVPGHQIAEMALAKLYTLTGERRYLDMARFFIDKRGYTSRRDAYSQAHKPLLEQDEAVGHAVRAAYMYAGVADVAALTGEQPYINAIGKIWDNVVSKKLYITGGIGATGSGEAFGKNYELPNMSAYCETCAAIGNVYWNHRLFLLHGDSKYYDVLERTLYNGLLSGVSLDGDGFFYPNPLESIGQHARAAWFGCACCPSNICRFIPSMPGYVYAVKENSVYVNLFLSNEAELFVAGKKVRLQQTTRYPWAGEVKIEISPRATATFGVNIRVPGWARNEVVPSDLYYYADDLLPGYRVSVNGKAVATTLEKGYAVIHRKWRKGDVIEVHFDMEPRLVRAHPAVEADRGRVAVERGPLVYCAEWPDNDFSVRGVLLSPRARFDVQFAPELLQGVATLSTTDVQSLRFDDGGKLRPEDKTLTLIPYYAWAHRGAGEMSVWLPVDVTATRPTMPPTIASTGKVATSRGGSARSAINDRLVPLGPEDRTAPHFHWWPKKNSTEWITCEFAAPGRVSASTVYWFDDGPWGGCRVPVAWKVYYKDAAGEWVPVDNLSPYTVVKGKACKVTFEPVTTTAVKLEVQLPEEHSTGLYEWEIN
ncbi:MAG: glycoside hydrolase family 127 protein [Odoribacteraceae bacterium]|jgi:DUF1680 family protein|nr:glycoside hydrolase family 127 protein [Odoribacteraceae bacterium]